MREERLSYLCSQAAQDVITFEELFELLDYAMIHPKVWNLILIEAMLWQYGRRST